MATFPSPQFDHPVQTTTPLHTSSQNSTPTTSQQQDATLRIAILEADTPLDGTRKRYGSYGGVFTSLLRAGAAALSQTPPPPASSASHQHTETSSSPSNTQLKPDSLKLTYYDVVSAQEYPPDLAAIDAILITGSRHNSFDNDAWILRLVDFVKQILAQRRIRLIGVCFGHQIIGRALGVKVARSTQGWEASVVPMQLTAKGQELFHLTGRSSSASSSSLALHQMHRDVVYEYPSEVEPLAYTDKCAVQGMYIARRLITVQGHPEFTGEIVREILMARHASGIFDDATFEDAIGRVDERQDGVVVAQAFLRFLLE